MKEFTDGPEQRNPLADHTDTEIMSALRELAANERLQSNPNELSSSAHNENVLEEAANRLRQFVNLKTLFSLLAPAGTAPRKALEELYDQSAVNADESPTVRLLRHMLEPYWGDQPPEAEV